MVGSAKGNWGARGFFETFPHWLKKDSSPSREGSLSRNRASGIPPERARRGSNVYGFSEASDN